jgi:hypothetical protein
MLSTPTKNNDQNASKNFLFFTTANVEKMSNEVKIQNPGQGRGFVLT